MNYQKLPYDQRRKLIARQNVKTTQQKIDGLQDELKRHKKKLENIKEHCERAIEAHPDNDHLKAIYFSTLLTP